MTRVCLVGTAETNLQYELLSRETAREALAAYDLQQPFHNSIAVDTVSLGGAVSLLNDLNWYLIRFVDTALVNEPSISETEWLSRDLATGIRTDRIDPAESERFLKVYGLEQPTEPDDETDISDTHFSNQRLPRLVEPMLVTRTGGKIPEYDLRDVEETLVVRVTRAEFGA